MVRLARRQVWRSELLTTPGVGSWSWLGSWWGLVYRRASEVTGLVVGQDISGFVGGVVLAQEGLQVLCVQDSGVIPLKLISRMSNISLK